jgi:hypothetical protein
LTRNRSRSLGYFRQLLDRHPDRAGEVAELFARSPKLREAIDAQAGFAETLFATCPELFQPQPVGGPAGGSGPNGQQVAEQESERLGDMQGSEGEVA